ncbi:Outer membrane protein beta-barrel domain-containing protein [Reichenbachiella agariperforans]|uniref:Outer membrane protein beta-barrel domain-containing protein n=1 Tax=Reichenbachiella agariperforans TaxID=156994 RepID=A0A1M6W0Z4_REIAG|nr:DUF6089 family protein [Reichenbachiella agariperforans]SHK87323.1 Outer membrane protein beta-barrel domain-containing protein [Reichenbachiella agariperforans]
MLGYFFALKQRQLYIILLLFLLGKQVTAQDSTAVVKAKEIVIGLGSSHYSGDLGSGYGSGQIMGSIGLAINENKRLNSHIILQAGAIRANELDYSYDDGTGTNTTPNESFNTAYFSLNFALHLNLIDRDKFKLYLSQGIGFIRYTPKDENGKALSDQSTTRALGETYRNMSIMIPSQLGFKYYLPNGYAVGVQTGFANSLTDYLDNISQWGKKDGNDNIFITQIQLNIPIQFDAHENN